MGQKITAEPSLGISAETVVNQQSLWEVTLQTTAVFSNKLGNFKMEQQQYEPNAAHQVTNIIQAKPDNEKVNLKDAYNMKAAIALGVIHIICGFIVIGVKIRGIFPESVGIWFIAFFFVTGGLAIGGALTGGNESLMGSLMVLTMVIAIIAAIFAGIQLLVCVLLFGDHDSLDSFYRTIEYRVHANKKEREIMYGLATAMSATMLIIAIASASLKCKPLCCRSGSRQGTVHYNPNQMPATYHHYNPNLRTVQEPSTSVGARVVAKLVVALKVFLRNS